MNNQFNQPTFLPNNYNTDNIFSLLIRQNTSSVKIIMKLLTDPVNTADYPNTFGILKKLLPTVLATECFNDQNLPFHKEVKNTEIGHLFEHILIEYMCQLKIAKGCVSAVYAGRTRWNWKREPRGLFHIHINCTLKDSDILPMALDKTIALMKTILLDNARPHHQFLYNQNGLKNGKKLKKSNPLETP